METPTGGSILERARRYISEGFFVVVCVCSPPPSLVSDKNGLGKSFRCNGLPGTSTVDTTHRVACIVGSRGHRLLGHGSAVIKQGDRHRASSTSRGLTADRGGDFWPKQLSVFRNREPLFPISFNTMCVLFLDDIRCIPIVPCSVRKSWE